VARRLTEVQEKQLRELEATLRQLDKLHQSGVLDEVNFRALKTEIENQREELLFPMVVRVLSNKHHCSHLKPKFRRAGRRDE